MIKNKLLDRLQFILDVFSEQGSNCSKKEITELVANKFKCSPENVVIYGLQTKFGGSRISGYGLIYNNKDSLSKYEPKIRLRRLGLLPKKAKGGKGRRLKKENKNKMKNLRGKAKFAALTKEKKKKK